MKINCYIEAMSSHSAKTAGRSAKAARRSEKKSVKSARDAIKKAPKSARRAVGKTARPLTAAIRAPSIAPKSGGKMLRTLSPPVQPEAAQEITIKAHKYRVGEAVYFTSPTFGR